LCLARIWDRAEREAARTAQRQRLIALLEDTRKKLSARAVRDVFANNANAVTRGKS
jgi:hypothetical protein